jgi:hypothetical protein
LFSWHGLLIDRAQAVSILCRPETITVGAIDAEPNQEIKRVMLDRYGVGRYLIDSGARLIHQDEFGKLYKMKMPHSNEELAVVAVKNATAELDGSSKEYFLHVHPELCPLLDDDELGPPQPLTARNAVASTFGLTGDEFWPLVET